MAILLNFLRSVLLTSVFSFITPILFVGGMLTFIYLVGCIPGLAIIGQSGVESIYQFLATFGSGSPLEGVWVIGLTCSLVGALFDTYAFYRYQSLRGF
jgi:hypothetical protein